MKDRAQSWETEGGVTLRYERQANLSEDDGNDLLPYWGGANKEDA